MNGSLVAEPAACDVLRSPGSSRGVACVRQPVVSFCLATPPAGRLRCLAEHPVRYLAELRAELPVVGLGQGT
jgi:hypothetical protein